MDWLIPNVFGKRAPERGAVERVSVLNSVWWRPDVGGGEGP